MLDQPTYDPIAVAPLRQELLDVGFADLFSPEEVDAALDAPGTALLVLNSVCGCSAGSARPGVCAALQNDLIPDRLVALFAGQEKSAVAHLRSRFLAGHAPSSPNIALFQDGKLALLFERTDIQGMEPESIAAALRAAFDKICSRPGPSVSPEDYAGLEHAQACGSKMPRTDGKPGSC